MLGGRVKEWHIPRKQHVNECTTDCKHEPERLSARHRSVLVMLLGFRKLLYSYTEGMCHSSTRPPNIQVCHCLWSVLPGLPLC